MGFSVLMSVYQKEKPEYLRQALRSVMHQTLKPQEIVLMQDGELTEELYQVIRECRKECPYLKTYEIPDNVGLGRALAKGVLLCGNELVARMDTDDIAKEDRFEIQYNYMKAHADVAVTGGFMEEFDDQDTSYHSIKQMPEHMDEILKYARYRNPLNHMTVMFRKDSVLQAGNYRHFPYLEDYDLWSRMLTQGAHFYNIQRVFVRARTGRELYARRGGGSYCRQYLKLRRQQHEEGLTDFKEYQIAKILTVGMTVQPSMLRKKVYQRILRK